MGLFRKKGVDVVDLGDMQRRGLISEPVPESNSEGIIDFSDGSSSSMASSSSVSTSSDSGIDFLSGLAGASGSPSASVESSGSVTSSLREARRRNITGSEISELKLKLDDSEYKIKVLNEKIKDLEMRLRELESGR